MREESSAAKGVFILSMAGIMVKLISVLYTPMLNSILGKAGYGVYSKTTEVFLLVYALSSMGVQPAVAKTVAEYTALKNDRAAVRTLRVASKFYGIIGAVFGMLMILFAGVISNAAESPNIALGLRFLAPCILVTCLLSALRGFMQGKNDMTPIGISQIIEQFLNVVVSLLCAFILVESSIAFGNAGAQVGTSVGALFACFYVLYCYEKKQYKEQAYDNTQPGKRISDKRILAKIIRYSVPITISAGLQNIGGVVDMFNVSNRLIDAGFSKEYGDILYGLLGKYKTLYGVPLVIITAIGTTILPSLTKSLVLKQRKEAKKKIGYAFRLVLLIAIPSAVGLSMVSTEVYIFLFGEALGADIMMYGSVILILMSITQTQSVILQAINKLYYVLATFAVGIVVKIIVNYILVGIPNINIYGVIIGNCLWHLIPAVLNHKKICKSMKMRMSLLKLGIKPIVASTAMAIVIYALKQPLEYMYRFIPLSRWVALPVTILLVSIGGFVYLYLMVIMGGISKRDIAGISPKIMQFIPRFVRRKLK